MNNSVHFNNQILEPYDNKFNSKIIDISNCYNNIDSFFLQDNYNNLYIFHQNDLTLFLTYKYFDGTLGKFNGFKIFRLPNSNVVPCIKIKASTF